MGKRISRILAVLLTLVMLLSLLPAEQAQAKKKKTEAELSKKTVEADRGEEFKLKLKSSYEASYYYVSIYRLNEKNGQYEYDWSAADYSDDEKGNFTFIFRNGGVYELMITLVTEDGQYFSDTCTVTVRNIGPAQRNMAVLIGSSKEIVVENATFVSAKVKENVNYWDYWNYWYDDDDDDWDDWGDGDSDGYNWDDWGDGDSDGYNWDDWGDGDSGDYNWNDWGDGDSGNYNWDYWGDGDSDGYNWDDDYSGYDYDWNDDGYNWNDDGYSWNDDGYSAREYNGAEASGEYLSKAYYYSKNDEEYSPEAEVTIDGAKITGVKSGSVTLIVTYMLENGTTVDEEVYVDVTDPVYTPFEGYFLANRYIYPSLQGYSSYSEITFESSDEDLCDISDYGIYLKAAGSFKLTITVDGRKFTDKIKVYAPEISDEALLLKKKKTKTLTVTGLPDGITPTYTTGNKKVATVTKEGKVKAKAAGNTYITVTCGDLITYTCYITVSKGGKAFKAAKAAYDFIGGEYSQENRMKDGYFDCSSLAWRSYKEAGEYLAGETKYAPTAANLGKKLEEDGKAIAYEYIDADKLLPGDLIFYSSGSNGRYLDIDHVAVYYAAASSSDWYGDTYNSGLIVHATSPAVHLSSYSGYCPYNIVMICRPID